MKKYKLKIEISPLGKLSPRFFISDSEFKKIRARKIESGGCKCEACGKSDGRMELHEGFTIKNNTYVFDGFYLLCTVCHDAVHYITMGSYLENSIESFEYKWRYKDVFQKYSIYLSARLPLFRTGMEARRFWRKGLLGTDTLINVTARRWEHFVVGRAIITRSGGDFIKDDMASAGPK